MTKYKRFSLMGLTVVGCLILDQASKLVAIQLLQGKGTISLLGDCLRFVLAHNKGGFLSLGASLPDGVRSGIFVFATAVFLLVFLVYVMIDRGQTVVTVVSSSMIIGGGIGNLLDRVLRDGIVIDFINIGVGRLRTGIFNIADVAVLFGCVVLIFCMNQQPVKDG